MGGERGGGGGDLKFKYDMNIFVDFIYLTFFLFFFSFFDSGDVA